MPRGQHVAMGTAQVSNWDTCLGGRNLGIKSGANSRSTYVLRARGYISLQAAMRQLGGQGGRIRDQGSSPCVCSFEKVLFPWPSSMASWRRAVPAESYCKCPH